MGKARAAHQERWIFLRCGTAGVGGGDEDECGADARELSLHRSDDGEDGAPRVADDSSDAAPAKPAESGCMQRASDGGGGRSRAVITADDFGFGVPTSAGIIHAHLHGPVAATSIMVVTQDHVEASVQLLADAPKLKLGLHLVLTEVGSPALVATAASGLVNQQRRFLPARELYFRCLSGKIDRNGAFEEICAQA